MSVRLANRSGRLVLTALAAVSLSVAATACSSGAAEKDSGKHSSSSGAKAEAGADVKRGSEAGSKVADGTEAEAGTDSKAGAGATATGTKERVGQSCGTNDLDFTVGVESQAGGYYLLTAKAKPGITCYLEGKTADVAFGSSPDSHAGPNEQAVSDTVKLSGATKAYAGVNPKSTNSDGGVEFGQIIVSVGDTGIDPVSLKLPDTAVVDRPEATNWHADRADAVPFS
ncbi:DUF4232 domain-containing protein [Streptomyces sp. NPDC051684]|uniref:DUF4232 domain-containing protein n=1 Tax=Streptomyces sp. NPDC051684 TaxID=3365670 RepID=UPI00379063B1